MPLLLLAALAAGQPALPVIDTEPTETRCDYITREGRTVEPPAPGLHVLEETRGAGPFAAAIPEGAAVRCGRSVIVPAASDWKVLAAGHPFYIVEVTNAPEARVAVLEISQGQVRYRFITGRLTEAEEPRIMARLDAFQLHFQR